MNALIQKLRLSPLAAWAGPLILFMGIMLLPSLVKVDTAGAVWWRRHPEQWAYPLQTIAAASWLWICRAHYRSALPRPSQLALAALMGLLGIALWILPGWLFSRGLVPEIKWLGCTDRLDGFDPSLWDSNPAAWWSALALRFIRMTLVVPLVEETFWRGFLWRTVSDPDREFHTLPFGTPQRTAFWAVAAGIVLAHTGPDRAAAFVWAMLTGWLYLRTRSLWPVVVMHAVANLALGIYVMSTRQWGYW